MKKIVLFWLVAISTSFVSAQQLEIVVPVPPGGVVDFVARNISKELTTQTGISSVVVNRTGGDGVVGIKEFLDVKGNTNKILVTGGGATLFAKLLKKPNGQFDPIDDLDMIGPVAVAPTTIVVPADGKIKTFDDFLALARREPVMCGTSNPTASLFLLLLASKENLQLEPVPFRGTADLNTNLIGNHIACGADAVPGQLELVKGSKLRYLVLSTKDHSGNTSAPVINLGDAKFENFFAVALHEKMDPALRRSIVKFVVELRNNPEFQHLMTSRGFSMPVVNTRYTSAVQQDYLILEKARIKLGVEKN